MQHPIPTSNTRNQRVRAIVLTEDQRVLFIKRIKPNKTQPYWVAPGGGVEKDDADILQALHRELYEELGAEVEVVQHGFVLRHEKANKHLEEHFYVCRLVRYDLSQRHGPEFDDPTRGEYIPHAVELDAEALSAINIKTDELRDWLIDNIPTLKAL